MLQAFVLIILIIGVVVILIPLLVTPFLRTVDAGSIRMVSWVGGKIGIFRGPGKSYEIPLLTTGTTLSSKAINVDLDITDQTADFSDSGSPQPIKVRVLASAIVSVGDSEELIITAANRYFAKPQEEQTSILIDLLSSSGRRAINLLTHDQLFSAKTRGSHEGETAIVPSASQVIATAEQDDDPLAIIIRKACSRELTDLGLIFNSLNIKVVQSEVAEALRRQSAAEAQANADIVSAQQARRAKEAQLEADRVISDKQRELEQTKAANAALIAQAEAQKQDALAVQRESELRATDIAQASADAERVRIAAQANAQASAIEITTVAEANAAAIQKITEAIIAGGESYLRYKQLEMLPQIAPYISNALAQARLITVSDSNNGQGASGATLQNINSVIQTVLAAQLFSKPGVVDGSQASESITTQSA